MQQQTNVSYLTEEEKEFIKVSPILDFYYNLLAEARRIKNERETSQLSGEVNEK